MPWVAPASAPDSLSTPAWAEVARRSTMGWAASAALSILLCRSPALACTVLLASRAKSLALSTALLAALLMAAPALLASLLRSLPMLAPAPSRLRLPILPLFDFWLSMMKASLKVSCGVRLAASLILPRLHSKKTGTLFERCGVDLHRSQTYTYNNVLTVRWLTEPILHPTSGIFFHLAIKIKITMFVKRANYFLMDICRQTGYTLLARWQGDK